MARAATLLLAVGLALVPGQAFAGTTMVLEDHGLYTSPIDFAVDGTHAYVIHARTRNWYRHADDVVLRVIERASGREVTTVSFGQLWNAPEDGYAGLSVAKVIAHGGGAVVAALNSMEQATSFAYIDRNGKVGTRRLEKGFLPISLARHGNFVVAANSSKGGTVALFDDRLEPTHEWTATDTLLLADSDERGVIVLDGVLNRAGVGYTATVRRLALADGQLHERQAFPVPVDIVLFPQPRFLSWPNALVLFAFEPKAGWRTCHLASTHSEFQCSGAAWTRDLKGLPPEVAGGHLLEFARSGDGYVVAQPNGCGIWLRRYDRFHSIAPRQLAVPSGSSDIGLVHRVLARAWKGRTFLFTSANLSTGWDPDAEWEAGTHRVVLHEGTLQSSSPSQSPAFEGCLAWSDAYFARRLTGDGVRSCISMGADPNAEFNCGAWTRPLAMAALEGSEAAVRALIAAGADVNVQDEEGRTALHNAARYARSEGTLQALLDGGADGTLRDRSGKLAGDYAQDNSALRDTGIVHRLLGTD